MVSYRMESFAVPFAADRALVRKIAQKKRVTVRYGTKRENGR
jgi:hypothetical protein